MAANAKQSTRRKSPRLRPAAPPRAELKQILRMVLDQAGMLERIGEEQNIQFRRMAQLQAELDAVKQALEKTRQLA
jgi:hypothetical protein